MARRGGSSARKYLALGYPAGKRLAYGTFSHGRCTYCGKINFASRKDAREAARVYHPGDNGNRPYECPVGEYWHYGHIPEWKLKGYESPDEWRRAREQESAENGGPEAE